MAKRMSLEEKRQAMLDIFDKTKTFYRLQELEKIGSREKGVVENTIKDVINGLLDDDLISGDKIGVGFYYWGNNNKKKHMKMIECLKLTEEVFKVEELISKTRDELENEMKLKPMSEEKKKLLENDFDLEKEIEKQREILKGYTSLNQKEVNGLKKEKEELIKEINRLTDNIYVLQSYVCDKFSIEKKDFNDSFHVSYDMDYVD